MNTIKEYKELLTALVDGELVSDVKVDLLNKIEADTDLLYDYKVQLLVKNIVRGCIFKKTPAALEQKIRKQILSAKHKDKFSFDFFPAISRRIVYAVGSALAVITAILLLLFNPTPQNNGYNFGFEQQGQDNMFLQARSNFQSILDGKLSPQITTADAQQIKTFFETEGVKYNTIIPELDSYTLVGAVVSEDKGEKFAHHIYADNEGHIVYLFQVNESYIVNKEILKISDALRSYLDDGNCYSYGDAGVATLMIKIENNIFAIVANVSSQKLETQFCNI